MDNVAIPHLMEVEGEAGARLEVVDRDIPAIWPWELLRWRDETGHLLEWVADNPNDAKLKCLASCQNVWLPGKGFGQS